MAATNDELKAIVAKLRDDGMTAAEAQEHVAQLVGRSVYTVNGWLLNEDSTRHRVMSGTDLELLKLKLEAERKGKRRRRKVA